MKENIVNWFVKYGPHEQAMINNKIFTRKKDAISFAENHSYFRIYKNFWENELTISGYTMLIETSNGKKTKVKQFFK